MKGSMNLSLEDSGLDLTILMAVRRILFYLPIVISRAPRYHYLSFLFNVIFYPVVFFYDVNGDSFRTLIFPCFTNALPWRFYLDKPWHNLIMHKKIGDCILSHKTDIFQQHSNNFCFLFRPGSFKGPVRLPSPTITKQQRTIESFLNTWITTLTNPYG